MTWQWLYDLLWRWLYDLGALVGSLVSILD